MKKNFLFLILLLTSLNSFAQLEKGKFFVGGNLNVFSTKRNMLTLDTLVDWKKASGVNVNPAVGYFIANNFVVGLNLGYNHERSELYNSSSTHYTDLSHIYSIGPFCRYYKMASEKIAFFGEARFDFNFNKRYTKYPDNNNFEIKNKSIYFGPELRPGVVYFVSSKVGLELTAGSLSYRYIINKNSNNGNYNGNYINNDFNLNFHLKDINLGVFFYL